MSAGIAWKKVSELLKSSFLQTALQYSADSDVLDVLSLFLESQLCTCSDG